ncbi:MAG: PEGA domain-containing protein [Fibrobacteria bacterium]|nr:PEGA domain-containing protein [Fibrobacteria bacterium]
MKSLRTLLSLSAVFALAVFVTKAVAEDQEAVDPAVAAANSERAELPPINADDTARDPSVGRPERGGMGELEINTRPAGGEVYFADEYRGKSPLVVKVPSGRNDLSIDLDGWNLVKMRVNVWEGKKTSLNLELKLPLGNLQIRTNPSKATITLDGKTIGSTKGAELNVGRVPSGKHNLCATAGSRSGCQAIEVPREDTLKVDLKLK